MNQQPKLFIHTILESKLREQLAGALQFVGRMSQEDVINCGNVCLTEIIRQYAIASPILRLDSRHADELIIEPTDTTWERKTGNTNHTFVIPIERDCEWLEDVDSQRTEVDDYPLAFLDKKRSRIRIILAVFPEDKEGELKRRLDHRAGLVEQYVDSVAERITDFNKDLAEKMAAELNKRKNALIKADKELEIVGLPRLYNPEHKEREVQIQKIMQSLGAYMTNASHGEDEAKTPEIKSFIVHGHDKTSLLELKNYIQNTLKLGEPIILREMPGSGKTIIEKFEKHAGEVDLIFVLLTPDDKVVAPNDTDVVERHARPNVIFEMGFFLGKLGRASGKILLLHKGPIELPSDISGIEYIDISGGVESAGEKIRLELQGLNIMTGH